MKSTNYTRSWSIHSCDLCAKSKKYDIGRTQYFWLQFDFVRRATTTPMESLWARWSSSTTRSSCSPRSSTRPRIAERSWSRLGDSRELWRKDAPSFPPLFASQSNDKNQPQTHLIFFKTFTRTNLRSDLRVKENSLRIDRGKCMGQRLRFPYNQAQQLNKQTKYLFSNLKSSFENQRCSRKCTYVWCQHIANYTMVIKCSYCFYFDWQHIIIIHLGKD